MRVASLAVVAPSWLEVASLLVGVGLGEVARSWLVAEPWPAVETWMAAVACT